MNSTEARQILLAHRPGRETDNDPAVAEALEQVRLDPELQQWWRGQQAFHAAMEKGFAAVPVPAGLRDKIRARGKIVFIPWWRQPQTLAAAAVIMLMIGLAALMLKPARGNSFDTYRSRMVRSVLRQYQMDIVTNDMAEIRKFLRTKEAPADYHLPPGADKLPASGAGVLSWQAGRVSMVCLNGGAQGTVFLFVADASEVKDAPTAREFAPVNKLMTASWTEGKKVYVLAAQGGRQALGNFF